VVETPQPNLAEGMRWLLRTCSNRLGMGTRATLSAKLRKEKGADGRATSRKDLVTPLQLKRIRLTQRIVRM
jgi:hypothetical protein